MNPYITVVMPAFNAELYIKDSIESILNQSFTDFEFIIINDGSTDSTAQIIQTYKKKDNRIKIFQNQENKGLVYSLNNGLKMAKGKYIARMDADDISISHRFERQVSFMDSNPHIGVSSAWLKTIGDKKEKVWKSPISHDEIMARLVFRNCIWHPVSIIRRDIIDLNHIRYNQDYLRAQDYHLWSRLIKITRTANIPEVLLHYRIHEKQQTKKSKDIKNIREELLSPLLKRQLKPIEKEKHSKLFCEKAVHTQEEFEEIKKWIDFLKIENKKNQYFIEPFFNNNLEMVFNNFKKQYFFQSIKNKKRYDLRALKILFGNNNIYSAFERKDIFKIIIKSMIMFPNNYF